MESISGDLEASFDSNKKKTGFRYKGGGRAVNFLVDNKFNIKNGQFKGDFINVKGCGIQEIAQEVSLKDNAVLSLIDAYKEFAF